MLLGHTLPLTKKWLSKVREFQDCKGQQKSYLGLNKYLLVNNLIFSTTTLLMCG